MRGDPTRGPAVLAAALFLGATLGALLVIRPFTVAPIGPDAAVPVIAFERLAAGQRQEGYLSQTSKPLLTVLYGVAHEATGGWAAVVLLAILAYAALVALGAWLAQRIAGPVAAGFAAVALGLSPPLIHNAALAYGIPWALLACVVAGLAVVAERPRYAVAGVALALGTLTRPEVLAVTGLGLAAVAAAHVAARLGRGRPPARAAWLLALGLAAVPVLMLHDLLLTGDALFWLNTAQANSKGSELVRSLLEVVKLVVKRELASPVLAVLAAIGVVDQLARGRRLGAMLTAIVPVGVALFFIAAGARGTVVSARYLVPVDLGVVFAAAIGVAAVDRPRVRAALGRGWRRLSATRPPAWRPAWASVVVARSSAVLPAILALAVGAAAAGLVAPSWPRARATRAQLADEVTAVAHANLAFARLRPLLDPVPPWRGVAAPPDAAPVVLIPPRLRAQGIVDLDLPLWAGRKLSMGETFPDAVQPGVIVYHDLADDAPNTEWRYVEVTKPTTVGHVRYVPLYADPGQGVWIVRVEPAG